MHIPVTAAKAQLTQLVKRAEGGEDVLLTRHSREVARIVAISGGEKIAKVAPPAAEPKPAKRGGRPGRRPRADVT